MYALIYDEHRLGRSQNRRPQKHVISLHESRETAELALARRQKKPDKRVWNRHTQIVRV